LLREGARQRLHLRRPPVGARHVMRRRPGRGPRSLRRWELGRRRRPLVRLPGRV